MQSLILTFKITIQYFPSLKHLFSRFVAFQNCNKIPAQKAQMQPNHDECYKKKVSTFFTLPHLHIRSIYWQTIWSRKIM